MGVLSFRPEEITARLHSQRSIEANVVQHVHEVGPHGTAEAAGKLGLPERLFSGGPTTCPENVTDDG